MQAPNHPGEQLRRLGEWKQPRTWAVAVGREARRWQEKQAAQIGEPLGRVWNAVKSMVDEEFCRHCRPLAIQGGVLTIGLDEPALGYTFRAKYMFSLLDRLPGACPGVFVSGICFKTVAKRG